MALLDTFTASNGTAINGRTMDSGQSWTADANYDIQSNRARHPNAGSGVMLAVATNSGISNSALTVTIQFSDTHSIGLIGRYTDASNYWLVTVDYYGGLVIQEVNAGVFTTRASVSAATLAVSFNTDYTLTFTFNGTSITSTCNGQSINYTSSFNQSATVYGLLAYRSGGSYLGVYQYDNFSGTGGGSLIGGSLVNRTILLNRGRVQ